MAYATSTRAEITVTLTLSKKEAQTLIALCCYVGGSMLTSARLHTSNISDALTKELGICHDPHDSEGVQLVKRDLESIRFERDVEDSDFI